MTKSLDTSRYMIKKEDGSAFAVLKFNGEGDFLSQYRVVEGKRGGLYCDCPHGQRPKTRGTECRHITMVKLFKQKKVIGKPVWYCFGKEEWGMVKDVENETLEKINAKD